MAAAAASLFNVNPVLANASANADVLAPLRAAEATKQQSGDEEFRQLFASWKQMDKPAARQNLVAMQPRIGGTIPGFGPSFGASQPVSIPSLIPLDNVRLSSDYGMRTHPVLGGKRAHKGVDLAAPVGTPIRASADGVVSRADWFSSYGLYVSLEHGGQIETRYGHMSRLNVAAGQTVHKGDIIGYVGTTGRSTGPHLHYEVRIAGEAVSPIPYLQNGKVERLGKDAGELAMGSGDE
ncbi:M23 family metallopeptidase [Novosphingobium flavum]|uniref:M23 family metallopeptidase n=2 Tax=Novosphingobium flavum TaxID=1778672 RepID=A0A7X1FP95_9SPHN|nr:M23 family metallopeptidase [Novosphingobium flavum]MBC2664480.1 M23 family metallopeptidase [Novosphingobium flavum]